MYCTGSEQMGGAMKCVISGLRLVDHLILAVCCDWFSSLLGMFCWQWEDGKGAHIVLSLHWGLERLRNEGQELNTLLDHEYSLRYSHELYFSLCIFFSSHDAFVCVCV